MPRFALAAALALAASSASAQAPAPAASSAVAPPPEARIGMVGNDGRTVGAVELFRAAGGVLMRFELTGLTPGWHAVHFHETGDCSDARRFQRAGDVLSHGRTAHGLLNLAGAHAGDLPNVYAGADGSVRAEVLTARVRLGGSGSGLNLMDRNGSSLVLKAGPDDHVSQPLGGSGERIACGVIRASNRR